MESHGLTDRGQLREHNEDSYVVEEGAGLFVVCDGMGGHAGGEVASKIAADTIAEFIGKHRGDDWPYGREEGAPEAANLLRNAALLANQRITERIEAEPWLARMGTTMVSALVEPDGRCHLANVGDSRGYLWREGNLRQLTSDHSWVNEQVLRGLLSRSADPPPQECHHPRPGRQGHAAGGSSRGPPGVRGPAAPLLRRPDRNAE